MKKICYIHGAWASPRSFAWIKEHLPPHEVIDIQYSCSRNVTSTVADIEKTIKNVGPVNIISHSLGGVMAVALAGRCSNVEKVATMSSPFGGSRAASFLQFITPGSFMSEIQPHSPLMREARNASVVPLCLVTTAGRSASMVEPNDGVVTIKSQMALDAAHYVKLPVNHFEILLSDETIHHIKGHIW